MGLNTVTVKNQVVTGKYFPLQIKRYLQRTSELLVLQQSEIWVARILNNAVQRHRSRESPKGAYIQIASLKPIAYVRSREPRLVDTGGSILSSL